MFGERHVFVVHGFLGRGVGKCGRRRCDLAIHEESWRFTRCLCCVTKDGRRQITHHVTLGEAPFAVGIKANLEGRPVIDKTSRASQIATNGTLSCRRGSAGVAMPREEYGNRGWVNLKQLVVKQRNLAPVTATAAFSVCRYPAVSGTLTGCVG